MEQEQAKWFIVLLNGLIWSVVGATTPNLIANPRRSHNQVRLANECLARLQIAFAAFYLNISIVIQKDSRSGGAPWISAAVGMALLFYVYGLAATKDTDRLLARRFRHRCSSPESCDRPLRTGVKLGVLSTNAVLALLSGATASVLISSWIR